MIKTLGLNKRSIYLIVAALFSSFLIAVLFVTKAGASVPMATGYGLQSQMGRQVVDTSGGNIYSLVKNNSNFKCEILKSTNGGSSFTSMNSASAQACDSGSIAIDSTGTIHIVYVFSSTVKYMTFSTSTDTFGTSVTIGSGADSAEADIAVDSNNKPHIAYTVGTFDGSNYAEDVYYTNKISGSWSSSVNLDTNTNTGGNTFNITGIAINGTNIPVITYAFTTTVYAQLGNQNNATTFSQATVTTSLSDISDSALAIDQSGNVWVVYKNTNIELREHLAASAWSTWQSASVSTYTSSSQNAPSISIPSSGTPYLFYTRSSDSAGVYTTYTGSWTSETILATSVSAVHAKWSYYFDYQNSSQIDFTYNSGSDVNWAKLSLTTNSAPAAPTLISPASGATGQSATPTFQLRTTDSDNDYLKYKIVIYNSDCSTSPQTFDQTSSQSGWSGQDQQTSTAYTGNSTLASSTIASFSGATLSSGTTYCWKAAAIDPGGSNTFGSYSGTQTFTTAASSTPSAPTLLAPISGATGTSTSPLFQLRATDANNDFLRYKIIIYNSDCSTNPQTFDESIKDTGQIGWTGQDQQTGTAYTGNSVLSSSAIATFGLANLSASTQYCWKAAAIDPGGSNTFGSYSATQLFTTGAAGSGTMNITGGTNIRGGAYIR